MLHERARWVNRAGCTINGALCVVNTRRATLISHMPHVYCLPSERLRLPDAWLCLGSERPRSSLILSSKVARDWQGNGRWRMNMYCRFPCRNACCIVCVVSLVSILPHEASLGLGHLGTLTLLAACPVPHGLSWCLLRLSLIPL